MQDSPFDQGHRTNSQLNFRQPFSDLTPYMLFSPFLSGFFARFAIWPGASHLSSIRYPSNVLWFFAISVIFTLPVRCSPFWSDCHLSGILLNLRQFGNFVGQVSHFHPFGQVFSYFNTQIRYFTKKSLEPHLNLRRSFGDFSCHIHNFSPSWQVFSVSARFVILVRLAIWPGTSHRVSIKFQSTFLWSFAISAIFNLSVRFLPFLPVRHLTKDISPSLH